MPELLRYLRIVWSAGCGMFVVILCVLWVRSCWWNEMMSSTSANRVVTTIESDSGVIYFIPNTSSDVGLRWHYWWIVAGVSSNLGATIRAPIWSLALLMIAFAAAPWSPWRWRYSLRTLLILITIVAVILGLIAWWVR
jgi:hypothetical protein